MEKVWCSESLRDNIMIGLARTNDCRDSSFYINLRLKRGNVVECCRVVFANSNSRLGKRNHKEWILEDHVATGRFVETDLCGFTGI